MMTEEKFMRTSNQLFAVTPMSFTSQAEPRCVQSSLGVTGSHQDIAGIQSEKRPSQFQKKSSKAQLSAQQQINFYNQSVVSPKTVHASTKSTSSKQQYKQANYINSSASRTNKEPSQDAFQMHASATEPRLTIQPKTNVTIGSKLNLPFDPQNDLPPSCSNQTHQQTKHRKMASSKPLSNKIAMTPALRNSTGGKPRQSGVPTIVTSSPLRSSYDNLTGLLAHTATISHKNSLLIPSGGSQTGKASGGMGSKKNSMHKVMLSDFVDTGGQTANSNNLKMIYSTDQATTKPVLKSRKNSQTSNVNFYQYPSQQRQQNAQDFQATTQQQLQSATNNNTIYTAEHLHKMHEKLAKLQSTVAQNSAANVKASKADRGSHYKKNKKNQKEKLHESGQFSPTTSKLIKHFLSKQQTGQQALIASLQGADKKSVPRKNSFMQKDHPSKKLNVPIHQTNTIMNTHSQRSLKQSRRQSVSSNNKIKLHTQQSQSSHNNNQYRTSAQNQHQQSRDSIAQKPKRKTSSSMKHQNTPYKISGTMPNSGSRKNLHDDKKVKPPLKKNNYMTTTHTLAHHGQQQIPPATAQQSPRQQINNKFVVRQSHKRDSQSSMELNEKKMAFSQSVQQLARAPQQSQEISSKHQHKHLNVKKLKKSDGGAVRVSLQNRNELLKSLEKIAAKQQQIPIQSKSNQQVSGSDQSSTLHNIVSINKHPHFASETFSDDQQINSNTEMHQKELLLNSDTNALALTSDQTKTKRKISKTNSQMNSKNNEAASSSKKSKTNKSGSSNAVQLQPSSSEHQETSDHHNQQRVSDFGPYGKAPISPIHQSLFDNLNSLTNNQTNLFSGRSSAEKLRNLVTHMQAQPQNSKEVMQSLEAMHGIIKSQEQLIKQFQKDMLRQEDVITRYEKHIRQLEGSRSQNPIEQNQNNNEEMSGFTDQQSSSLQNPSSHCNNNLGIKRQDTDVVPNSKPLSPCDIEDSTVKYNLTEKSSPKAPVAVKEKTTKNLTSKQSNLPTSSGKLKEDEVSLSTVKDSRHVITESKLILMEDKERLRLKLSKKEKQEKLHKQKINKLMFFFFTLQNKGVLVNEIYEQEGIKAIRTDRFDEIMAQIAKENGDNQGEEEKKAADNQLDEEEYSFYSEDSYELLQKNPDIQMQKYERPNKIPALDLDNLPDYESSSDEEECEEQAASHEHHQTKVGENNEQQHSNQQQDPTATVTQDELNMQRESMSQNDYRQSLQYIEKFYQKHQMTSDEKGDESGENHKAAEDCNPFSADNSAEVVVQNDSNQGAEAVVFQKKQNNVIDQPSGKAQGKKQGSVMDDRWNPISTPQNLSGCDDQQSRGPCPSQQVNNNDQQNDELQMDQTISEDQLQHSERNSSLQISLLSPPSQKHLQQSQSMVNTLVGANDKISKSSHPYYHHHQSNPSSSKRQESHNHASQDQDQSQLESIDMILSHDPHTKESNNFGSHQ